MIAWQSGLHPDLVVAVTALLAEMQALGHPMFVAQGLRSLPEQQAAYAKGRTEKGPVVTNCDGVKDKSNHQPQADGYGHAVDCAFQSPYPWSEFHPWKQYGTIAKKHGLAWGGDWLKLKDRPHVELPKETA